MVLLWCSLPGGDPTGTGNSGESIFGHPFKCAPAGILLPAERPGSVPAGRLLSLQMLSASSAASSIFAIDVAAHLSVLPNHCTFLLLLWLAAGTSSTRASSSTTAAWWPAPTRWGS